MSAMSRTMFCLLERWKKSMMSPLQAFHLLFHPLSEIEREKRPFPHLPPMGRQAGEQTVIQSYFVVKTVNSVTLDITRLPCSTERQKVALPFFILPVFTMAV